MYHEIHFEVEYWDCRDPSGTFIHPDGTLNLSRATSFNVLLHRYYVFYDNEACVVFQFSVYHPMMSEQSPIEVFQDIARVLHYMRYDVLVAYLMPKFVHVAFPVVDIGRPRLKLPDPRKWQRFIEYGYRNM